MANANLLSEALISGPSLKENGFFLSITKNKGNKECTLQGFQMQAAFLLLSQLSQEESLLAVNVEKA